MNCVLCFKKIKKTPFQSSDCRSITSKSPIRPPLCHLASSRRSFTNLPRCHPARTPSLSHFTTQYATSALPITKSSNRPAESRHVSPSRHFITTSPRCNYFKHLPLSLLIDQSAPATKTFQCTSSIMHSVKPLLLPNIPLTVSPSCSLALSRITHSPSHFILLSYLLPVHHLASLHSCLATLSLNHQAAPSLCITSTLSPIDHLTV